MKPAEDQQALQGIWTVESYRKDGEVLRSFVEEYRFEGDKFTELQKDGREGVQTFEVDATQSPKKINLFRIPGAINSDSGWFVYELRGDILRIIFGWPGGKPKEISDKGQLLVTLKRKKP